jgi:L-glutamine-phosphate cytidylyltransferase
MSPVHDAIILAAGTGLRLRSIVDDRPKGLIEIEGETLVGRSVRLLRDAGIRRITIVAGYAAEHYERYALGQPDIQLVVNGDFATTGSMASLAVGLKCVKRDAIVLESDLVYESRALQKILNAPAPDVTLTSGPTGAGDEVWVDAPHGRLRAMSKSVHELRGVDGEFVGITRLSWSAGQAMLQAFGEFVNLHGHARMDYETGALVTVARSPRSSISVQLIRDLCWGEIDDEQQYQRVVRQVWPVVRRERRDIAT